VMEMSRILVRWGYSAQRFARKRSNTTLPTCIILLQQAICLGRLIEFFEENNENDSTVNPNDGYIWAMGLVLCGLYVTLEHHHVFFFNSRKGMQFRVSSVAAIFDKALRLSSTHQETLSNYGRTVNLASNDAETFYYATNFVSFIVWSPLLAVGILLTGTIMVGWAFASGIGVLVVVFVPAQLWLSGSFAKYRSRIAAITDQRLNFVSQAVRGARVMKLAGYETLFLERIQSYRAKEVMQLERANRLKATNEALFFVSNIVVSYIIFLLHVLSGNTLRTGDVFLVFTLVNVIQMELAKSLSLSVMFSSQCSVSIQRIEKFLDFPEAIEAEAESPARSTPPQQDDAGSDDVAISMSNVSCRWNEVRSMRPQLQEESASTSMPATRTKTVELAINEDDNEDTLTDDSRLQNNKTMPLALQNISIDFHRGTLTAVIGPVGGGKSALLQALIEELPVSNNGGFIRRRYQSLAYAAQDAWIMDGTIRDNIIMGRNLSNPIANDEWYEQVVSACALSLDFSQLRDGDQTIVGDRGVQLSGGQRARVGLARALYKDADVLVADDPLSAVDARVGRHLFQEAIMKMSVKKGKCVILATHQHQYVHDARCLLVMSGQLKCTGSYQDCVAASGGKLTAHEADTMSNKPDSHVKQPIKSAGNAEGRSDKIKSEERGEADGVSPGTPVKQQSGQSREQDEKNKQGLLSNKTFASYLNAMGGVGIGIFLALLFILTQTSVLVTVAAMGRWAERDAQDQDNTDIFATVGAMSALVVLLSVFRAYFCFELTIKASQKLHDKMAESVLRAKIEFFDTNPLGRIVNRFSSDVGVCDDQLPQTLFDFFMIAIVVVGAIITALTTLPFALAILPFLIWYFIRVRKIFVTSTRELKRLDGLARSPIYSLLSEALGGIATIRANNYTKYFRQKFYKAHDAHTETFFAYIASSRWVGFRMDLIVFLFLASVTFLAVVVQNKGWFEVDPAILGLSISMLIYLAGAFQWCIRQSAEAVNQMVSVERMLEYSNLPSEAALTCDKDDEIVASGWPRAGQIDYQDVSVRYRSTLPLALQKINFHIPAGARVGVVGRTGSGKSTVVQSLFRLLESENGRILIDGVDVSKLGLHALRTSISVIPQTPTLFSGCSVRENLDLFGLHSDDEISKVLEACHLIDAVKELPDGWNYLVSEGGSNFSVGERQLLCLGRALLSQNKILVLDEATASVDRRTDQLLQEALQESYNKKGTILAVAHRLDTIIDYDFILVLGQGEVLEFGTPAELLSVGEDDGVFARMVQDTGDAMSKSLREKAGVSTNAERNPTN